MGPSTEVNTLREPEVPAGTSTFDVPFSKIAFDPETVRLALAVTTPPNIEIEPDEVIAVLRVTSVEFWVAPETVPPVPDWPIVTLPMLPPFTPVMPLIDHVLSKVCADANEAEPAKVPEVTAG